MPGIQGLHSTEFYYRISQTCYFSRNSFFLLISFSSSHLALWNVHEKEIGPVDFLRSFPVFNNAF